ncbi:hypothetical protein ACNR9Q_00360 [Maribacter sp. X9]|uniref:hypothetical protein n=1 Tax=Maribacter sp. X9 TaxID=3402159 RepID=UPI003AF3EE3F
MNNTSLEIMYNEMISNLWEELLFFIPDNEVVNEFLENHKEMKFEKFRNKVLIIDYHRGPIIYKKGRENKRAILKASTLQKNIRQLLSKKVSAHELEFNYVLELYYEQAECLYFITDWLLDNIQQVLPQEDTVKGLFKMQHIFFKVHYEAVLKQFYPDMQSLPKGNFNIGKSIESSFPNISKLYDARNRQLVTTETSSLKKSFSDPLNNKMKSIKAKKQPILSDSEAEIILLQRIFNMNHKNLCVN